MKCNQWTLALAAAGVVSLGSIAQAEEGQSQVLTALSQTTLSGYIDTSAIWQPGTQSRGGALPGHTFTGGDRADGFNLHAVKLTLERPLDEAAWSAGYKADLVFGPDANYYSTLLNHGVFEDDNDFAIKQAYVALRAPVGNGLDIKLGVWDTLVGYEVFESGNNPNFTRSYGYALEPTQHTGVLLSYHVNEWVSLAGGVANNWTGPVNDRGGTAESEKTYLGSVTVTLPEQTGFLAGSTLYLGVVDGKITHGFGAHPKDSTHYYAGFTMTTPVEGLAIGAAADYRNDGVIGHAYPIALASADSWAWATAVYASYQALEKLKLNVRADYTRGSDGTFFDSGGDNLPDGENELGSLTLTADYSLWANVISRAEVRWDHSFSGDAFDEDEKNALIVAANLIYKF